MVGLRCRATALLLAVAMLVAIPATASFARIDRPVPIRGNASTEDFMLPPDGCPATAGWRYLAVGSGDFSHLGAVDFELTHCSRMTSELTGEFDHGITTITAANGDVLTLAHRGTFELEFGDDGAYSYVALEWEVLGGTGRFAGASGSGDGTAVGDLLTETTTASYNGTINYDASNRAER
jgi:hypothetical protein